MANVTRTTVWSDNQVLNAAALNGEFNNLLNNLQIVNADVSSTAAIDGSKIGTTLSGKIFTNSAQTLVTATDGATVTFDMSLGNIQTVTLGGNRTLALSNVTVGQTFILRIVQSASGNNSVTWFSTIKWVFGSAPTLTTTANKTDVFGFICTSSGNFDGYIVGQGL